MQTRTQIMKSSGLFLILCMVLLSITGCADLSSGVAAPDIDVSGTGVSRTITITSSKPDTFIFYTTDGATPDAINPSVSTVLYTSPLTISGFGVSHIIKAIAVNSTKVSDVRTQTVTIGSALSLSGAVSTLAGSTTGGDSDGIGASAGFSTPYGITTDGTNLYIADSGNSKIRKIEISTRVVTTLAGSTTGGSSDGTGSSASFMFPVGITTDGANLYVSDSNNNEIRKIVISTGEVTTLAGSTTSGSSDGTGSSAKFYTPGGITTDGTNLYLADTLNNEIRKVVISTGVVTTLAGSTSIGSNDGTGASAGFYYPMGITTDGTNLYVTDSNPRIRKIVISTGEVTTLAGSTTMGSSDGTGTSATFNVSYGITTDGTNLYVADSANNEIRKIVISTGVVTTLAGSTASGSSNGTGTSAGFHLPSSIAADGINLYVADTSNNEIRKIE